MKKYWQSIDQLNETPEFLDSAKNEFAEDVPTAVLGRKSVPAVKGEENSSNDFSRRDFLKVMGFSVGAATLAACETPVNKTIPYLIKPEEITPGIANYYASTYFDGHDYCSVLVKTREGRPIKIEGNKKSKISHGGTSARVQASVLSLYDSERLKSPLAKGSEASWNNVDSEISSKLSGGNIRILSSTVISPSTKSVIANFKAKYPNTKHVTYDAVSYYAIVEANENVMGAEVIPSFNFDKANVIVSFGADFLVNWLSPVEYAWQYAQGRKLNNGKKTLSKHVQFETTLSLTGSNADLRVPVKPSQIGTAVLNLYNAVASMAGEPTYNSTGKVAEKEIADCAKWLWANKGKSLVVCGVNDVAIQTLVGWINKILGNYGHTIDIENYSNCHQGNDGQVSDLMEDMRSGKVNTLIVYNSNPAYTLPGFADAMKKVGLKISLSSSMDETASMCDYVCPDHHYLESWNDAEPKKNQFSLTQPTIAPIYKTRCAQETLMMWSGNNSDYHSFIQATWEKLLFPAALGFTEHWNESLHNGVAEIIPVVGSQELGVERGDTAVSADETSKVSKTFEVMPLSDAAKIIASTPNSQLPTPNSFELVLYEKTGIGIGNQANNPWLQELPDPISKCTWDNYITMNPTDMKDKYSLLERGDYNGDIVELRIEDSGLRISNPNSLIPNPKSIKVPVFPQPGQALGTIGLALGYGRTSAGKVANGVGVDAYQFLQWKNGTIQNSVSGVKVSDATGEKHEFACTQTHHTMMGRETIVRETNLETYNSKSKEEWNPMVAVAMHDSSANYHEVEASKANLWDAHDKPGHRWGLAIDLNSCIGCGACVVSCSAENNVPVVGKTEVRNTREMHWIRIDRYYSSDMSQEKGKEEGKGLIESFREMEAPAENPKVVFQPIMCQHCNHAPCETVCPVLATTHSSEGLNQMIYNRCIGTRYCANNCPYKVRRFNWFQYDSHKMFADVNPASWGNDLGRMVLNPDIVVRSRGVMEKCTFCVQRIQEGKLNAKKEDRKLTDGDIQSACQTACPTNALLFGDLNNPETEISKLFEDERRYLLLEEVGVQPNAFYLTKVRNA
ncbi:MAG: TAT-variant-translocated molybdopterin oxidoreductase [Bacteroidetes bacterium]|nr:TAT-variant-translocated molybdopterin oxidoreductase [Bacteroidota bacterium]